MNNEVDDVESESKEFARAIYECEERFLLTENVIHIFEAITLFDKANLSYIDQKWIVDYLTELSSRVINATNEESKDKRMLTAILGMSTLKDFTLYKQQKEINYEIFKTIETECEFNVKTKVSKDSVFEKLAKKYHLCPETVRAIYYKLNIKKW